MAGLSQALVDYLQGGRVLLLTSIEKGTGHPYVTVHSWLLALDPRTLHLAVDSRAPVAVNIRHDPRVCLAVFGPDTCHAVRGRAQVAEDPMAGAPLTLARVAIQVDDVQDAMYFGARLAQAPAAAATYDAEKARRLDEKVYAALRKA